jgi:hypothetical protein
MAKECHILKKDGKRCRADAQSGKDICVFHDPTRAADGHSARRAGGATRSRMATVLPQGTPDNPLRDTHEVVTLLGDSINHLRRGQLDPRVANAVGYLSGILLKALEQGCKSYFAGLRFCSESRFRTLSIFFFFLSSANIASAERLSLPYEDRASG